MNGFFSDRPGVYPPGPGKVSDSCYLIRHGNQNMVWDTGLPAETKYKPMNENGMVASIDRTLADQLGQLGVKPADVSVLGISHMHGDHIGQAAQFTSARLVVGKGDFDRLAGRPEDSLKGWRGAGKQVTLATADVDVFGDGSVVASAHLPAAIRGEPCDVPAVTLRTVLARTTGRIGVLKMDCEGAEAEILETAGPALDAIQFVVAEFHQTLVPDVVPRILRVLEPSFGVTVTEGQRCGPIIRAHRTRAAGERS